MNKLFKLAVIIAAGLLIGAAAAQAYLLLTVPNTGEISLAYGLQSSPATLNWGTITQLDKPYYAPVTLTNTGTKPIAHLNFTLSSVTGLTSYTLKWDAEGQPLYPEEELVCTFNLTVQDAPEGTFSFDININDNA